jgi:hypothetical protein
MKAKYAKLRAAWDASAKMEEPPQIQCSKKVLPIVLDCEQVAPRAAIKLEKPQNLPSYALIIISWKISNLQD